MKGEGTTDIGVVVDSLDFHPHLVAIMYQVARQTIKPVRYTLSTVSTGPTKTVLFLV